jgi:hypothetical protein
MSGREGVNFLFAFELFSFVSRPDSGQIVFKNRARLPMTKTFLNAFFERVQTLFLIPYWGPPNLIVTSLEQVWVTASHTL